MYVIVMVITVWIHSNEQQKSSDRNKNPAAKSTVYAFHDCMLMNTVIMWKYNMFLPTPTTSSELQHLPLPQSSMDEVALKVSRGIATERIMEGLFILIFTVCTTIFVIFERGLGIESTDIPLSRKCLESTTCQNKTSAISKEVYLIDKSSAMRMMPCL